jgi:CheY-like chemotaxis protein
MTAAADTSSASSPEGAAPTVLLVEDEVLIRMALAQELRNGGYTVIEAANSEEALRILCSNIPVDLVLTDIRMPGSMDGAELVRTVRTAYPTIKLVISSAYTPDSDLLDSIDGFMSKPVDFDRLVDEMKSLLP